MEETSKAVKTEAEREILDSKEFTKAKKDWNEKTALEFIKKTDKELETVLVTNSLHAKEIDEQIKANSAYQAAKRTIDDFNRSKRDRLKSVVVSDKLAVKCLMARKKVIKGQAGVKNAVDAFKGSLKEGESVEISTGSGKSVKIEGEKK